MNNKLLVFLLSSISIIGCKNDTTIESNNQLDSYELVRETNRLELVIDSNTTTSNIYLQIFESGQDLYLAWPNRFTNSVQIYNLKNREKTNEIFLKKEGPNAVPSLQGFLILDNDNVVTFSYRDNDVYLVDGDGNIKNKNPLITKNDEERFPGFKYIFTGSPISLIQDSIILISRMPLINPKVNRISDDIKPTLVSYNLLARESNILELKFPDIYKRSIHPPEFLYYYRCIGKNGQIVISFPLSDELVVYESINNAQVASYPAKSAAFPNDAIPYLTSISSSNFETNRDKNLVEASVYSNILYDKYRNVYYRFAHIGLPYFDESAGKNNTYRDKATSIIVLDEKFRKVGETPIKAKSILESLPFVLPDGLYIAEVNSNNEDMNEKLISFSKFALQPK